MLYKMRNYKQIILLDHAQMSFNIIITKCCVKLLYD